MATIALLLCCLMNAYAQKWASSYVVNEQKEPYAQKVSSKPKSFEGILSEVRGKFNVDFLYTIRNLPENHINFNVQGYGNLEKLLHDLLNPHSLKARKIFENTYAIVREESTQEKNGEKMFHSRFISGSVLQNPVSLKIEIGQTVVSGRVTDKGGSPLPGVSVLVKGSQIGTSTGMDGDYRLENVPQGAILVFSFIGFQPLEEPVNGREQINVTLEQDLQALDEVVVVGYGTQKKSSLTSAVSTVSAEELTQRPARNLATSLQGLAPGLTVWDQGGEPGSANVNIKVRGVTTLNNNSPLVIVDGIEQGLNDINPNDIATISVLKDAASTAIYGSRAANGVILVTTKRGKAGTFKVNYNAWLDLQNLMTVPEHMDAESYLRLQNLAYENRGSNPLYTEEDIQKYVSGEDRLHYPLPNTWFNTVVQKNAPMQNHSLSFSGGSERITSLVRLNYFDQQGIYPNRDHTRYEIRMNNDLKISDAIKVNADLNIRRKDRFTTNNQGLLYHRMIHSSQLVVPVYPDGTYGLSKQKHSPLAFTDPDFAGGEDASTDVNVINLKGTWNILKGLTFTSQYAFDFQKYSELRNFPTYEIPDYWNKDVVLRSNNVNQLREFRSESLQKTWNNTLNYNLQLNEHHINLLGGYSEISNDYNEVIADGTDFYNNDLLDLGQSDPENRGINSAYTDWGLQSAFGRVNYIFKDKYILEFNARYDGSSRFPKGNRYTFFPSVAGAWRISEESFFEPLKNTLDLFKIRASWGKAGNQNVGLYTYFNDLTVGNYYVFNEIPVTGVLQTNFASQDLTWEITSQTNIGLDLSMFRNRFNLTFDWFDKTTEGILLELPIPGAVGLNPAPTNAGSVKNNGWELQLNYRNNFRDLRYGITFNLSNVKNEVLDLAGTGPYYSGEKDWFIRQEGQPIDALWGYRTDGYYTQEDMDSGYPLLSPDARVGDLKYVDLNNDGAINSADRIVLGSSIPRLTYGTNINLGWKNLDFNL